MRLHLPVPLACRAVLLLTGHRLCCRIPEWLAGPNWEPVDVKLWDPYNVAWRLGQALIRHGES